ncbi:MAG: DUF4268 domain-containing protein [Chitinophagales bacterium]|nr:DUF4268 domain-containing protein [Chitinophagales bacterium]MDW8427506.1 DUF4268 domain-containing protein [Chitinophagales bacterium]
MFVLRADEKKLQKLPERKFADLGIKERQDLQEWIAQNPSVFGEELLIIQKEFSGFQETGERLDLLAIDKQGNLVTIENKLDDTGRDAVGQALKYAAYCSTLKKEQIKQIYEQYLKQQNIDDNAEERLLDFFGVHDFSELNLNDRQCQRIILIAARFRKEVTSTVLWLLNYKLRIQCFKVSLFEMNQQMLVQFEQIIPLKDAEEFIIKMAEKTQDEMQTQRELAARHQVRLEFWRELIRNLNEHHPVFRSCKPTIHNYLVLPSGIAGVIFCFVIANSYARVEVYFKHASVERNKKIFDKLFELRSIIEQDYGKPLIWERLNGKKACRIKDELLEVNYFNRDDWQKIISHLATQMPRLIEAFRTPLKDVVRSLGRKGKG